MTWANDQAYVDDLVEQNVNQLYAGRGVPVRAAPQPGGGQAVSVLSTPRDSCGFGVANCETALDGAGIMRQPASRGDACHH